MDTANEPAWVIQRDETDTYCENPHPVRLGRNAEHWRVEPNERRVAIDRGLRGYRCPGGEVHSHPVWIVYDAANDSETNAGVFDSYTEALACKSALIAKAREASS